VLVNSWFQPVAWDADALAWAPISVHADPPADDGAGVRADVYEWANQLLREKEHRLPPRGHLSARRNRASCAPHLHQTDVGAVFTNRCEGGTNR